MMLQYNIKLAIKSLRHRPGLTVVMIAAIGIGIALLMTALTMSYQLFKVPIAHKADELHIVKIDNRGVDAETADNLFDLDTGMTYTDAMYLYNANTPAVRQAMLWKTNFIAEVDNIDLHPLNVGQVTATRKSFFALFETPFLYGGPWSDEEDASGAPVIVISRKVNDYFFGGENSVGKEIKIEIVNARIVGVLDDWDLNTRFYDESFDQDRLDGALIPMDFAMKSNLRRGDVDCLEKDQGLRRTYSLSNVDALANSECRWLFFWVELKDKQDKDRYKAFLHDYTEQQKQLGRIPRDNPVYMESLRSYVGLIKQENGGMLIFKWLAYLFLTVCLLNTIGILLAKFLSKIKEVSLRRAVGATRMTILGQYLIEISIIGFIGGVVGLLLSLLSLQWMFKIHLWQADYDADIEFLVQAYQLDVYLITVALVVSVVTTLIAGLYPAWRICNVPPATYLKTQ